jgi:PAS domain S-box-containing protein
MTQNTQNTLLQSMLILLRNMSQDVLLKSMQENISASVYFKIYDGKRFIFAWVSKAKSLKHGFPNPNDLIGMSDENFMTPEEAKLSFEDDLRAFEGEIIRDRIEKVTRNDGTVSYLSVTKVPWTDNGENVFGIIGISQDITRRMEMEELVKTDLHSMTHDFKNMLVGHHGLIDYVISLLAKGKVEKSVSLLTQLQGECENFKERLLMTNLRISQLGIEKPIQPETDTIFDLTDLFNKINEKYQPAMKDKSVELDSFMGLIPPGKFFLKTIYEWLYFAVDNIFSNEIKHGGEKLSRMTFGAEMDNEKKQLRINVSSDGVRIDPEFVETKLFKKGQRAKEAAGKEGTGFGLYTAREYMRQLGGEMVYFEENQGEWMGFVIILPLSVVQFPPE